MSRHFPNVEQVSAWVIEQLPPDLSADGRWLDSSLTAAQRADPERVARFCLEIVEKAYKPDLKVDGPLSEFLGIADDAGTGDRVASTQSHPVRMPGGKSLVNLASLARLNQRQTSLEPLSVRMLKRQGAKRATSDTQHRVTEITYGLDRFLKELGTMSR